MVDSLPHSSGSPLTQHLHEALAGAFEGRPHAAGGRPGLVERLVRGRLEDLTDGQLHVHAGGRHSTYGQASEDRLEATLTVVDPAFWSALATRGSVGAAEAYSQGLWYADDLAALVRLFARNGEALKTMDSGLARLAQPVLRLASWLRPNHRAGARRNIAAHYDLSNEFFQLWLDPTMTYSAGIFETPEATLEQASRAKLDRLCRKLDLGPQDHLLEIGTGWGSMALHAAEHYGCRVTTTTISERQHALASERVRAAGLEDRITLLFEDYRDLTGSYDKLVSVEMIEAVGHHQFPRFFAECQRLLAPSGIAAVQAITIADQEYDRARREVDFIRRYIFPGSTIPSITRLCESATGASDLRLSHLEDLTPHYARTLFEWRCGLYETLDEARAQGFDDEFLRMWEFYLAYCEGAFDERHIQSVQLLFSRPGDRRQPVLPQREALARG